ncbi:LINE-1 reverse transcriptase homolog [Linum grandiflorum]
MAEVAISFYKTLFGNTSHAGREDLADYITLHLSLEDQNALDAPYTRAELKSALFSIKPGKAPGPDGLTSVFYKSSWEVVGEDVLAVMDSFFVSSVLPPTLNSTIIAMIPKKCNATHMHDYQPISCCNTIYKSISKVLANRLKLVLPRIIRHTQAAFVKGRHISDHIIHAHELLSSYSGKNVYPRCAMMIDLMKAFDSVEWGFLIDVLQVIGLPNSYVSLIQSCLYSSRFSVNLNGSLFGYFPGKKGLRQGDPISPYLFVISMQVLDGLFSTTADRSLFSYHPQCKQVKFTHLYFADDLLVFTKGTPEAVTSVTRILDHFHLLSGLQFNAKKSDIYTEGVSPAVISRLVAIAGLREGSLPMR